MKKSVADQVRRQIKRAGEGSLFLVGDFANIGSRDAITRTLSRLAHEGTIRRLQQGIYEMPRVSRLLGKPVPPDPAQVAQAIARRTGNRIIPTDAQTANRLGLTTQVQAKNVFLTDGGKKRQVTVGNQSIELRPVVVRHFSHNESESVIQGLRFVGESNITNAIIGKLRGELTASQKAALRRKIGNAPEWMRDALKT